MREEASLGHLTDDSCARTHDFVTELGAQQQLGVMGAQPVSSRVGSSTVAPPNFRALFEQQFSYVWNALRRLGVPDRDLEDLTQQVFLQVHRQLPTFEPGRPVRPWLFAFAFNAASNHRQLARHRVELCVVAPETADPLPPADEQLITRQELELAELALSRVSLERRAVLLLHDVEGHSIPEVADSLNLPLNTAYSRLRLARQEYETALRRLRAARGER
ncbi:MAG TPA: RNA polymerase sigma factor [Polyangiaceae bacterium]|jgi:RNA polymerase sigma-70 factor (ECF subfamily)